MKLIFMGLMFCEESLKEAKKNTKSGLQMATHYYQVRLLNGLQTKTLVDVINIPPIGSFPINYRKPVLPFYIWDGNLQVGYINFPCIKHLLQEYALCSRIRELIKDEQQEVYLLAYGLYEPFLRSIRRIKKEYSNVKACIIQTDAIPGIEDMDKYMTKRSKRLGNKLLQMAECVDSYVLVTRYQADILCSKNKPYTLVECICDVAQKAYESSSVSENICLYTGTTMREYGICDLVDAFSQIENGALWICGQGDGDEYIYQMSEKYPNIKHFGFLDRSELDKVRNACNFVINPRRPSGTYTKHSFPSKTAEYLMSGKPCLMYKLEGIPDEYDQYINYLSGADGTSIAKELKTYFSSDYSSLLAKAKKAREYMIANKNEEKQAAKILSFLERQNEYGTF